MKKRFSFLHISDLHLSNRPTIGRTDEEVQSLVIERVFKSLENAVQFTLSRQLDALFIAGDFIESERLDAELLKRAFGILEVLGETPVFISPGNHDLYDSLYTEEVFRFYGIHVPGNIVIFSGSDLTEYESGDVRVYGCANRIPEINPFRIKPELEPSKINIGLIHGSLTNYIPEGKEPWLPFDEEELLGSGFDYVALGHYHSYKEVTDSKGIVRAAYPGSLVPVTKKDTGPRGGLLVKIEKESDSISVKCEFIELARLCLEKIEVAITEDLTTEEIRKRIISEMNSYSRPEDTVFYITLTGSGRPDIEAIAGALKEQALHIEFDTENLRYFDIEELLERYSEETTIGMFIRRIAEALANASDRERRILMNTLAYGIDALQGREIRPRYEDKGI